MRKISEAIIRRLPRYFRQLDKMQRKGQQRTSSQWLGEEMGLTASQIRQDFNQFGGFGQQGYGYKVGELKKQIEQIIGLGSREYHIAIIGAGNIGRALAGHRAFEKDGYEIVAVFDVDPRLVGTTIGKNKVQAFEHFSSFVRQKGVDIAVLAVPEEQAEAVAENVAAAGVKALWNFAPVDLEIPGTVIENTHLTDSLMVLTYRMNTTIDPSAQDG